MQFDSESCFDPSWLCMYDNLGIDAESWDPLANLPPLRDLEEGACRAREDIVRTARGCTPHRDFLRLADAQGVTRAYGARAAAQCRAMKSAWLGSCCAAWAISPRKSRK